MRIEGAGTTAAAMPIRVVVANDYIIVVKGLESLLAGQPDFTVVATCTDGEATLDAVRRHRPDVLVIGAREPGLDGLEVVRALKREPNSPRVVLLTACVEDDEVLEAMRLGVAGIALKDMPPHVLFQCIRQVHAGEAWIDKQMASRALERMLRREANRRDIAAVLTRREIEIVRLAAQGLRTRIVADRLSLAENTVKTHLHHIYEKLKLDGRVALSLFAREKGLT